MWHTILTHPFTWGLAVGLFLVVLCLWSHFKTRREFSRYRKHLSDRLELDSKFIEDVKRDRERLTKENENLRILNSKLSEKSDQRVTRDLEVYARAEKAMNMQAPGFSAAWEMAKTRALDEMRSEEEGASLPQRLYRKIFGGGKDGSDTATHKLLDATTVSTPAHHTEPAQTKSDEPAAKTAEPEREKSES